MVIQHFIILKKLQGAWAKKRNLKLAPNICAYATQYNYLKYSSYFLIKIKFVIIYYNTIFTP